MMKKLVKMSMEICRLIVDVAGVYFIAICAKEYYKLSKDES
jgi:hypothetical protein